MFGSRWTTVRVRADFAVAALLATALCACGKSGKDLTVAQLTAVVSNRQGSLQPCYQQALDKEPNTPEFRVRATLHVDKEGSVKDVKLDRGPLPGVGACVEKAVRTWKFPKATADTYASLPIIFRPVEEPIMEAPRNPFE